MSIASEITRIKNNISSAYTAVNNKGGTLPATQNSENLATAINSISGSGGYTEFPSYQVVNGVASRRSGALTGNEFSNITSVDSAGLYYTFCFCSDLTGALDLSSLTTVGYAGLFGAFVSCAGLTSVNLSALTSVGDSGLSNTFNGCSGLTSVDLSSLTTVGNQGLYGVFNSCTGLTNVNLSALTSFSRSMGLAGAFSRCSGLTDIYFNSLTTTSFGSYTDQFYHMLDNTGTSVTHTLHFPSNLESTIQGLDGYPTFGGTSGYVVLAFDLPSTQ